MTPEMEKRRAELVREHPNQMQGIHMGIIACAEIYEKAIKKHRAQTGHNMCWENDQELWEILFDGVKLNHIRPPRPEFLKRCQEYCDSRQGV